jgi:hypothetical protein
MNNNIEQMFLLSCRLQSDWQEVWLPIKGYKNYEVSSRGRVYNIISKKVLKRTINAHGYPVVNLNKNDKRKTCKVHRLVCIAFYLNPENKKCVDHKNSDKMNNNVQNLRFATNSENCMNRTKHSNNTSGTVGVNWQKSHKKWRAQIKIDGISKHLGYFTTIEAAERARIKAVNLLFKEFAHKSQKY